MNVGLWTTCMKPIGGVWTQITGLQLQIFAQPTFAPPIVAEKLKVVVEPIEVI